MVSELIFFTTIQSPMHRGPVKRVVIRLGLLRHTLKDIFSAHGFVEWIVINGSMPWMLKPSFLVLLKCVEM